MAEVLYRKYRSQLFSELIGQEQVVTVLQQTAKSGSPSHAYLFTGPRGTGKTSSARIFAKAINCTNTKTGEPCGKCVNCKSIAAGEFMDIIEIDAASNRGINEIRELREKVAFAPAQGKFKVYIIDEVHMLTSEAFNALLKTLEEPPDQVVFILATTEIHKVPVTILSRVVRLDYKLAQQSAVIGKLRKIINTEGQEAEEAALEQLADLGGGSFRDTESLLEKVIKSTQKKITPEVISEVLGIPALAELEELLSALLANESEVVYKSLLGLEERGVSPAQIVQELSRLLIKKIATTFEQGSGEKDALTKLFYVAATLRKLLAEINNSDTPWLQLKLALANPAPVVREVNQSKNESVGNSNGDSIINLNAKSTPQSNSELDSKSNSKSNPKLSSKPTSSVNTKSVEAVGKADSDSGVKEQLVKSIGLSDKRFAGIVRQVEIAISKDQALISVPYKFHFDRLSKPESKQLLTRLIGEITGKDYQVNVQIGGAKLKAASSGRQKSAQNQKAQPSGEDEGLVEEIFSDIIN